MNTQKICPVCQQVVKESSPETGGTVTLANGDKYHYNCWMRGGKNENK